MVEITGGENGTPKRLKMPVSLAINIIVAIAAVMSTYFYQQSKLDTALQISEANRDLLKEHDKLINSIAGDLRSVKENFEYFRHDYEKDANKYIREPGDRR